MFLAGLLLLPVAAYARDRFLIGVLVVYLVLGAGRFGGEWLSLPAGTPDGEALRVVSWNLQAGAAPHDEIIDALLRLDADLVAVQELTTDVAAALEADGAVQARYPHRLLDPHRSVLGIGLLSTRPIIDARTFNDPPAVTARVDLGEGRTLTVFNAHPTPGRIGRITFDATRRDAALVEIRGWIDDLLDRPEPLLVLGDYNVTPDEPGYAIVSAGLRDAHREVGLGTGWTWRPERATNLGLGLIRIDYVFMSPALSPLATAVDCAYPGDHCILLADIAVP